ncbi:hypothetical protein BRARA_C04440 [Brassica rapa]|uniref:Uncharacterized protein n=1 Tax=Brassica campestris TaxID=3711 RepID=A0A398A431_BRACM|nr:hypothetical protein BRARA_C04440 [Brassica rapa]
MLNSSATWQTHGINGLLIRHDTGSFASSYLLTSFDTSFFPTCSRCEMYRRKSPLRSSSSAHSSSKNSNRSEPEPTGLSSPSTILLACLIFFPQSSVVTKVTSAPFEAMSLPRRRRGLTWPCP